VEKLTSDDIIAIAAYVSSRDPTQEQGAEKTSVH
jgi:hypothetical protein